jgi:hypothetical protein
VKSARFAAEARQHAHRDLDQPGRTARRQALVLTDQEGRASQSPSIDYTGLNNHKKSVEARL